MVWLEASGSKLRSDSFIAFWTQKPQNEPPCNFNGARTGHFELVAVQRGPHRGLQAHPRKIAKKGNTNLNEIVDFSLEASTVLQKIPGLA